MMIKSLIVLVLFHFACFSQTKDKFSKEEREMIDTFFNQKNFDDIHERMDKILNDFFNDDSFDNLFDHPHFMAGGSPVELEWIESKNEKKLVIKHKGDSNDQLNVKIKDHLISISGSLTKNSGQTKVLQKFSNSISIPLELDPKSAKFSKNTNGDVIITFKKRITNNLPKTSPVTPTDNDVTI